MIEKDKTKKINQFLSADKNSNSDLDLDFSFNFWISFLILGILLIFVLLLYKFVQPKTTNKFQFNRLDTELISD